MILIHEYEVKGWKDISVAIGVSVRSAQLYAIRSRDPLPVYFYLGRIVAHATALRDWCDRQRRPLECRELSPATGRRQRVAAQASDAMPENRLQKR